MSNFNQYFLDPDPSLSLCSAVDQCKPFLRHPFLSHPSTHKYEQFYHIIVRRVDVISITLVSKYDILKENVQILRPRLNQLK